MHEGRGDGTSPNRQKYAHTLEFNPLTTSRNKNKQTTQGIIELIDTPLLPPWPNVMLCHLKEEFYSRTLKKIFATSYKLVGGNVTLSGLKVIIEHTHIITVQMNHDKKGTEHCRCTVLTTYGGSLMT